LNRDPDQLFPRAHLFTTTTDSHDWAHTRAAFSNDFSRWRAPYETTMTGSGWHPSFSIPSPPTPRRFEIDLPPILSSSLAFGEPTFPWPRHAAAGISREPTASWKHCTSSGKEDDPPRRQLVTRVLHLIGYPCGHACICIDRCNDARL
jgi:hypothetical protein